MIMRRLLLILIAFVVVAGIVLAAVGALSIQNTPDKTSITIDKTELKEKAQEAIHHTKEAGSAILKQTGKELHKAGESLNKSPQDQSPPTKSENPQDTSQPGP
jgi:hypothetical protein